MKPFPQDRAFRAVLDATGIDRETLCGSSRKPAIAYPRFAIMLALSVEVGLSQARIGRIVGNRDHSSVAHALKRATSLRDTDTEFADLVDRIAKEIDDGA